MTLAHHNCQTCGRIQLDEPPAYPKHGTIPERLRAVSELYDPKHVEGDCTWCTDVGAARLMREAAAALEVPYAEELRKAATVMRDTFRREFDSPHGWDPSEPVDAAYLALDALLKTPESEIVRCTTCNWLGELPPRSDDPEDTAPAPPCPDCQPMPVLAVGNVQRAIEHLEAALPMIPDSGVCDVRAALKWLQTIPSQVRGSDAEAIQAFKDRFPPPPNPRAKA